MSSVGEQNKPNGKDRVIYHFIVTSANLQLSLEVIWLYVFPVT